MARIFGKNPKKVVEEKVVERPILLEIYKWLDGTIEAYDGGTIPTKVDAEGKFVFNGKNCEVKILCDGVAIPEKRQYGGEQVIVTENKFIDATPYVDSDRLEKLSEDEQDELSYISYKEIHDPVVAYKESTDPEKVWTAWLDALGQVDQALRLPKSHYQYVPKFKWEDGRTVVWFDVHVAIDGVAVEQFVSVLPYDLDDRIVPLKEGTAVAEKKYCGAGDKRISTFIYRFSIPKSYFK
jgi:hypothetical protein